MTRSGSRMGFPATLAMLAIVGTGPVRAADPPGSSPTRASSSGPGSSSAERPSPRGFSPRSAPAQREAEALALTIPTPENARRWLRVLTAEPHVAGTPADHRTAVFVRDQLREWGWKAEIAEIEVLINYPVVQSLQLKRPQNRT